MSSEMYHAMIQNNAEFCGSIVLVAGSLIFCIWMGIRHRRSARIATVEE